MLGDPSLSLPLLVLDAPLPRHHDPKSSGDDPGPEPTASSHGGSALLPT